MLPGNRTNAHAIQVEANVPMPSFRRKPESSFVGHELGPGVRRDEIVLWYHLTDAFVRLPWV